MRNVLTVLNAGTNFSRDSGDVVADLARHHLAATDEISLFGTKDEVKRGIISEAETEETKRWFRRRTEVKSAKRGHGTWLINAGPGGGRKGSDRPGTIDPLTGETTFTKDRDDLFDFEGFKDYEKKSFHGPLNSGALAGVGMDHNVVRTLAVIDQWVSFAMVELKDSKGRPISNPDQPPPLKRVNLVGWSRGAVTCHMIANAIANYRHDLSREVQNAIRKLEVNIFAFDPVPGGSPGGAPYTDQRRISVPGNVKRYVGIYAGHDARNFFKPAVITSGPAHLLHVIMPGDHSQAVQAAGGLGEVAAIAKALCHRFLVEEGTDLIDPYLLDDRAILQLYDRVNRDLEKYGKRQGSWVTSGGRRPRAQDFRALGHPDHPGQFVNAHHEGLFKAVYPQVYRKFV